MHGNQGYLKAIDIFGRTRCLCLYIFRLQFHYMKANRFLC